MPFPLWAIPVGMQAGSSLLKYATRKRTPSFGGSAYGKYLKQTSREGIYSPEIRSRMLGQVSSQAGNVAQQERSGIRGYLEARGMGGSIAGARTLAEPGQQRMRTVSGASERLGIENELSKQRAREAYAQGSYQTGLQHSVEKSQARSELIGGLTGAGMAGYQGYQQDKYVTELGGIPGMEAYAKAARAGVNLPYSARPKEQGMSDDDFMNMTNMIKLLIEQGQNDMALQLLYKMMER